MDPERRARWLRKREVGVAVTLIVSTALSLLIAWTYALAAWPFSRLTLMLECALSAFYLCFNAALFFVLRRKLRALPEAAIRPPPLQLS